MKEGSSLPHDWFQGIVPVNVDVDEQAYIETTFGLTKLDSSRQPSLIIAEGAGLYSTTVIEIAPEGRVSVGAFTCLNASHVICNLEITIGSHCLISWQVVITDTLVGPGIPPEVHRDVLRQAADDPNRRLVPFAPPQPVVIEDVVWIGFGSVIMPGVTVGRGSIVGCKTVVDRDVPPYAVVVGNPFRIIRYLDPDTHTTQNH